MWWWLSEKWWVLAPGTHRQQWARIAKGGTVTIYDARGRCIVKTQYRNRLQAAAALRRRGFRQLRRRDAVNPPIIQ
jgi:hypothetical protein